MLNLISEIFLLLQCAVAGSARALEQADHALVRPRKIFTKQPLSTATLELNSVFLCITFTRVFVLGFQVLALVSLLSLRFGRFQTLLCFLL